MVVIEQYSGTQFNSLSNTRARILYDTTQNAIRWNDSQSFNNFLISKDSNNNVTGINNVTMTGTLNISNSGTDSKGLQLAGTLVTVTSSAHNLITGNIVNIDFTSGGALDGVYEISICKQGKKTSPIDSISPHIINAIIEYYRRTEREAKFIVKRC